jgi:hypothetical protein
MPQLCPFCNKSEPAKIDLSSVNLRICPVCKATFIPAEQLPELRRVLEDTTKTHWINALSICEGFVTPQILCLEHQTPLEKGTVPGYSYETLVPKCCSLQHLSPNIMKQILSLGLGTNFATRPKKGGIGRFLAAPIFRLFEKKNPAAEDDIDRLQYNFKFKEVLER